MRLISLTEQFVKMPKQTGQLQRKTNTMPKQHKKEERCKTH